MNFISEHPILYHQKALDELKGKKKVKKRWTETEVNRLAREEAEIMLRSGPIPNINEELKKKFPDQTIQAIKRKEATC